MFNSKKQQRMSVIVFGIYCFLLTWLILFKFNINFVDLDHTRSINLIPFKGSMIVNGQIDFSEIIYNVLVFVPLGVYNGVFCNNWSFIKKILLIFGISIFFEATQFVFAIGATDITDIIGNTLGGVIGIFVCMLLSKIFKRKYITVINVIGMVIEVLALGMLILLLVTNM